MGADTSTPYSSGAGGAGGAGGGSFAFASGSLPCTRAVSLKRPTSDNKMDGFSIMIQFK